jgi:glycosyltransferase involved in cell wall biosynthesis
MVNGLGRPVCLVQPTLFPEASRVDIHEYSFALARQGIETHVIVSEDRSQQRPALLTVHSLGFPPRNTPLSWLRFARQARAMVRRLMRERNLALVHLFNPSPATWLLGRMMKNEDHRPALVYDLRTGGLGRGPDALLINAMARSAARFADAIIALTPALGRALLGGGAPFHHVPLGVNLESFRPAAPRSFEEFIFVYAGTLSANRSLSRMIEAFELVVREYPRARLRIAGDGDDQPQLQALVKTRGLQPAVTFLGKRDHREIPALLADAHCGLSYVPQTPWFEPQPQLKTLEYLAMDLPAVAVRTQGNTDYWAGLPAELLTADDPQSFADGMRFALTQGEELRRAGFRQVAERHSWERITGEQLVPLYERLLEVKCRDSDPR